MPVKQNKMEHKKGHEIETRLRKFFRGTKSPFDEIDFETSTSLYEVKSCNLFNTTTNQNSKRKYRDYAHKNISAAQLGRFFVKPENHIGLYLHSLRTNKIPKYIFVLGLANQIIYKILPWEKILIFPQEKVVPITLKEIFYDRIGFQ